MATRKIGFTPLLTAIHDRLRDHANTSAYTVYNYVKKNATLPYIKTGIVFGGESPNYDSRDYENEDLIVIFDIWSKYTGDKECADIMNNISIALSSSNLTVAGYNVIDDDIEFSDIIIDTTDPNEIKRHGIIRWKFQMSQS